MDAQPGLVTQISDRIYFYSYHIEDITWMQILYSAKREFIFVREYKATYEVEIVFLWCIEWKQHQELSFCIKVRILHFSICIIFTVMHGVNCEFILTVRN